MSQSSDRIEHLPECLPHIRLTVFADGLKETCQTCAALRACEQRMYEWSKSFGVGKTFYDAGRDAGLDAAREAVEALVRYDHNNYALVLHPDGWAIDRDEAIAAIDALRGHE